MPPAALSTSHTGSTPRPGSASRPDDAVPAPGVEAVAAVPRPPEDPKVPRTGTKIGRRYELRRRVGAGATGVVFEAVHTVIGKRVALKWLHRNLAKNRTTAQRFLNEARAVCRIDHPNVIEVFDAGRDGDSLFLVMEILRGESLSARLQRGFEHPHEFVEMILPALDGVEAAHQVGIVHRDLKPENIFLCSAGRGRPPRVKVLDFGVSKLRKPPGAESNDEQLTRAGAYVGSPFYTAPEQITHCNEVDGRADVYSLGVILYESLTGGSLPHEADSLAELFQKIRHGKPRWIGEHRSDLPKGLEDVIHKAIEADPDERFASVDALARALEPFSQPPGDFQHSLSIFPVPDAIEGDDAPTIQDAGIADGHDFEGRSGAHLRPAMRPSQIPRAPAPLAAPAFESRPPPASRSRLSQTYQELSIIQRMPWYVKALVASTVTIAILLGILIGVLLRAT